jgi:hypothetical protein
MHRFLLAVAAHALLLPPFLSAQGPPIQTDTPILLGLEGKAVMLRTIVVSKSRLYQDGSRIPDPLNRKVNASLFPVTIPYNVTTDVLIGATLPLASVRVKSRGESTQSFGLSDISIFAKYLVVQVDRLQETFRIIGKGSVKLPTGSETRNPPLGTGTTDVSIGGVAAWIGNRFGAYGDVSYSFIGTSGGTRYGDVLGYNIAVGFRLSPAVYEAYPTAQWNLYLELNGRLSAKNDLNGTIDPNSGGHAIFLSPGVQLIPSRFFLLEASWGVPLIQSLNGTQLGTDFSLVMGARVLLY